MTRYLAPERLIERGAFPGTDVDFRMKKTTCCGSYVVYESKTGFIYTDSTTLGKAFLEYAITGCPVCGNEAFGLSDAQDIPSEWGWACEDTP